MAWDDPSPRWAQVRDPFGPAMRGYEFGLRMAQVPLQMQAMQLGVAGELLKMKEAKISMDRAAQETSNYARDLEALASYAKMTPEQLAQASGPVLNSQLGFERWTKMQTGATMANWRTANLNLAKARVIEETSKAEAQTAALKRTDELRKSLTGGTPSGIKWEQTVSFGPTGTRETFKQVDEAKATEEQKQSASAQTDRLQALRTRLENAEKWVANAKTTMRAAAVEGRDAPKYTEAAELLITAEKTRNQAKGLLENEEKAQAERIRSLGKSPAAPSPVRNTLLGTWNRDTKKWE
jgi:hypothetical protein